MKYFASVYWCHFEYKIFLYYSCRDFQQQNFTILIKSFLKKSINNYCAEHFQLFLDLLSQNDFCTIICSKGMNVCFKSFGTETFQFGNTDY